MQHPAVELPLSSSSSISSNKNDWNKFKCITILSERSQSEKTIYCMIPTMWHSGKSKSMETVKKKIRGG